MPASAAPRDPVQQAAGDAVKRLDLQVTLPREPRDTDMGPSWHLGKIPVWLLYVAAALAAGVIVYVVLDMIPGRRPRDDESWGMTGDGLPMAADPSNIGLTQADDLAARGFFVEAIHVLLLHSLAEIRRRLRLDFADSLTSREILRRARLPEEVARSLRGIVARVELSYFGGYPASRPDYDTCRAGFEALSAVLAKGLPETAR